MKKDLIELFALDSIVIYICAVNLGDGLLVAQILAALSASAYSWVKVYDWWKKRDE